MIVVLFEESWASAIMLIREKDNLWTIDYRKRNKTLMALLIWYGALFVFRKLNEICNNDSGDIFGGVARYLPFFIYMFFKSWKYINVHYIVVKDVFQPQCLTKIARTSFFRVERFEPLLHNTTAWNKNVLKFKTSCHCAL